MVIGYESAWPQPAQLDVQQLLASGAVEGPFVRTRPITSNPWRRMVRALRVWFINRRSPL